MVRNYRRKTDQRKYQDREFSVRAVHRDPLDLHLLAQVLIRHTFQQDGESRAARRTIEVPETYHRQAQLTDSVARPGLGR